ncbi:ThiF family adenylyltransferase [Corynebacterium renale]|uniref:Adenylyltransferase/sulfurtransferase n=1 Tax=Corynebacterium renale TaxID=1724 RepID=A0A2A9DPE1_9CORY|nr:ThiF family adenylyltransferase [Corynebacterium renale]PFG27790.1 adenylyltransferase/sulfurtransferase [Corynebacterium renale]SQI22091.1 thiamine biosynthesis protein ThiF [Corynebacterium renale]
MSLPDNELRRVARQTLLPGFGLPQQEALHNAHVLIIGAGGLGCPVAQALAATGVGTISIIDDDTVDLTNIHRQILFTAADVGRPKVDAAAERLRGHQPGITVNPLRERLTAENAVEKVAGVDLLIDGSDTFATKYLAADAAELTGTPLIWGSVLRFRGDVALWWSGGQAGRGVGLRDLYPTQPDPASAPDCATAGVLGVTTSVVGGLMATEAVKFLAGMDSVVPGHLLMYDALSASIRQFHVAADPARELVTSLDAHFGAGPACGVSSGVLSLLDSGAACVLDVREPAERLIDPIRIDAPVLALPTSIWERDPFAVESLLASVPKHDVVVVCASGVRSQRFVDAFADDATARGLRLFSLPGGVQCLK